MSFVKLEKVYLPQFFICSIGLRLGNICLKAVVSASCYRYLLPSAPVLDHKSIGARSIAVSQILCHFPSKFSLKNHEVPFRFAVTRVIPTGREREGGG